MVQAGDSDRFNDQQVREHRDVAPDEARANFDRHHARVVEAIAATEDGVWDSPYPFDPDVATVAERIGSLLGSDEGGDFTHARAHLPDLRAYVASTRR